MLILKILGGIDLIASLTFLMIIFGINPFVQIILFSSGLLLLKGMFVLTGDVLSIVDIICAIILLMSILISLPTVFLWLPAFILMAKGAVSFI
jgi:hypothetical protein